MKATTWRERRGLFNALSLALFLQPASSISNTHTQRSASERKSLAPTSGCPLDRRTSPGGAMVRLAPPLAKFFEAFQQRYDALINFCCPDNRPPG